MSDTVIKVENLPKCYLLGHNRGEPKGYETLREVIEREGRQFGRKAIDRTK